MPVDNSIKPCLAIHHPVAMLNSECGAHMLSQGFGTWQAPKGEVYAAVKAAIKAGYRLIDCAKIYCNQEEVGQAIKEALAEELCLRSDLFIVSKIWNTDHAPEHVASSARRTLQDLGLEYLDLLLVHWPVCFQHPAGGVDVFEPTDLLPKDGAGQYQHAAPGTPHAVTWKALEKLVTQGKVKDIGLSNFNLAEVKAVIADARIKPAALQIEVHPGLPQQELRAYCAEEGIVVMAYCPLAIGMADPSAGLLHNPQLQAMAAADPATKALAAKNPISGTARLLLQWSNQSGLVCLSKSVTESRVQENAQTGFGGLAASTMAALAAFGAENVIRVCDPDFGPGNASIFPKTA